MEEWAAVCRQEEYMSREHEMDSVMERIIINADGDDDDDDNDNDETQGVDPTISDSE